MNTGKTVFAQLQEHLPLHQFRRCVKRYDVDGAIADFNQAIQINPVNNFPYRNRGVLKLHKGQQQDGCTDLRKAESLGDKEATELIKKYCPIVTPASLNITLRD